MKTLYVLRHGEAARENEGVSDHERELTRRGRADVARVAGRLQQRSSLPSLVLSSSATRARHTAELCLQAWPAGVELAVDEELYLAGPESYLAVLAVRAADHRTVMVVGHNPGLEALVELLTDRSEHLATASLVELTLPIVAWAELSGAGRGSGRLVHTFRP
jgi:phosphohistidine phosphatase